MGVVMSTRILFCASAPRRGVLAALTVGVVLALGASSASAIIYRLPNGRYLNYMAIKGKPTPTNVTRKAPRTSSRATNFEPALSNLDYSGGPVMPSNVNYVIDWEPSNYAGTAHQSDATPSHGYVFGVAQFFKDLQAGSTANVTNNSDSISSQYNDVSGHTAAYSSQLAAGPGTNGSYLDQDPLPSNGCSEGTYCITDQQLQNELASYIASQHLPAGDLTHEYYVLTPPNVVSCFDAGGTVCSGNANDNASKAFCAYHSQTASSPQALYSNIPDLHDVVGCDPFVTTGLCNGFYTCFYNSTFAEASLSAVSHEHNESTTDPEPNNAWTDWQSCGQGAPITCGGEIGDKCNGDQNQDPLNTYQSGFDGNAFDAEPFNETINGHHYWLQMEWSNQGATCAGGVSELNGGTLQTAPGASFTATADPSTANQVDFNASASGAGIAQYVWQFNDDVKPGDTPQQNTVETTSPTITHTFPQAGTYTVALTTMTADGRSEGTATQTVSAGLTQAAFTVGGSPVDASPVPFDASPTSHDSNVGISSYSWNFGDGSTGSGITTSHRFAPGAHTVALTVTDTLGRTSSLTHSFTVADLPPTAAFTAPTNGHAGAPVQFRGSGADDEAIIYRWSFGDGGAASGASASHTFRRAGTYVVTLTVTDADGISGSAVHPVKIGAPRCVVPRLQGQTLGAARGALAAAQCKVGKVTQPKHRPRGNPPRHKHWVLVVIRTSPGAGSVKPVGTKVNLVLAYKAMAVRHTPRR
jgi:PKD repeat protein